jgi:pyruvate dehydrogenase E1 component alpha subunit
MPLQKVGSYDIEFLQILDENGRIDSTIMPEISDKEVKDIYKAMVLGRVFDDTCLKLQREGRILTYASIKGQEAAQVASAYLLKNNDWLVPCFRENAAMMLHGVPMHMLLLYWNGDERGSSFPKKVNVLPVAVPVATQLPHAVGIAWGLKMKGKKDAVMVFHGDGATSEGDFHEALNFAGVFKVPAVIICQNNQWAISVPVSRQTAAKTLAQKAIAYQIPSIKVDGNDVFAVYKATKEALERAKNGGGPTFIEAFTYRLEHHTTADDWKRYRSQEEVDAWSKKEPISRLKKYMVSNKLLTETEDKKIWNEAKKQINIAVKKAESIKPPKIEDIFNYTYSRLTQNLQEQLKDALGD